MACPTYNERVREAARWVRTLRVGSAIPEHRLIPRAALEYGVEAENIRATLDGRDWTDNVL